MADGRGRRRRLRRGPDRRAGSRSGWPSCSATRPALFTPTGSMANQLGLRLLVAPGEEVLADSLAHVLRAELGAAAAFSGITIALLGGRARAARRRRAARADGARRRARTWCRHAAVVGREHPQLRRRHGPAARRRSRRCARGDAGRGRRHAPGRRAALERPRRHGRAARGVRRSCSTPSRSACPRASAPRSARCSSASRERDRRGAGLAQAVRRRHATGRDPRRRRAVRARAPRRAAGRRPRARASCCAGPATRPLRASSTRPTRPTNIVVLDLTGHRLDAAALVVGRGRRRRRGSPCSARARRGWSRTSTSTRRRRACRRGAGPAASRDRS